MFSTIVSGAVNGIESYLVKVEVDVSDGLPCIDMVGFLSSEVKEAKERVRVALRNSGYTIPTKRVTVNLSPANIRKDGSAYDLPIAIGILTAVNVVSEVCIKKTLVIGELGLDGDVRFVKGILPIVMEAKYRGIKRCIIPVSNLEEGKVIEGVEVIGVANILEVLEIVKNDENSMWTKEHLGPVENWRQKIPEVTGFDMQEEGFLESLDFAGVNGQEIVKRAAEVAAAGFHHLLIVGPPGSGKTMIAKRIPGILPPMTIQECLEVSKIYSVSGLLQNHTSLIKKRPFLNPHHTVSEQALAGGGRIPRPGMISLAHRGVLFLDELPEFKRNNLDIMRQPIEDKEVQIARSYGTYTFPADFMLVGAMNPCPCGYFPDRNRCNCTEYEVKRYLNRISGPLLDRIDVCVEANKMEYQDLVSKKENESSNEIRKRVMAARQIQMKRYEQLTIFFNSELNAKEIEMFCKLGLREEKMLGQVFKKQNLSARAYHRILKVARTIADLDCKEDITEKHLAEAICYRTNEQKFWGKR